MKDGIKVDINIDTSKTCLKCGSIGVLNETGICMACAEVYFDLDKPERELALKHDRMFYDLKGPKCPKCNMLPAAPSGGACLTCIERHLSRRQAISLKHLPDHWPADAETIRLAKRLIAQHHPDALTAKIAYTFRRKHSSTNDKVKLGSCAKQSPTSRMLHGWDYIIELAYDMWAAFGPVEREALLLHELLHVFKGEPNDEGVIQWKIEPHNLEAFVKEVEVYGLWKRDLEAFAAAIRKLEGDEEDGPHQMSFEEFARQNSDPDEHAEEVH